MQESSTAGTGASSAAAAKSQLAGVEIGEISGKRLFVEFAAFGFFKRTCQLELRANGDSVISKGMVTPENGAWRIEVRLQCGASPESQRAPAMAIGFKSMTDRFPLVLNFSTFCCTGSVQPVTGC